jgi:hypothetical protein
MTGAVWVLVMKWWIGAWDAYHHCLPDDRLFVAMLTAWVAFLAVVTYLLLGWVSAGVVIIVAGLFGIAMNAAQSRQGRRQDRTG